MAQLIKLHDFISRYETDIYRYPSQYIRLKQERWRKIKIAMNQGEVVLESLDLNQEERELEGFTNFSEDWLEDNRKGIIGTIKNWLKKEDKQLPEAAHEDMLNEKPASNIDLSMGEQDIKLAFLNELFEFQMNWASSTVRDRSFVDRRLYTDEVLKYFLQHFPDNYLLMYKPTIIVRKAPVDLDIILISPVATYCITLVEGEDMSVYRTDRGRYWYEDNGGEEKRFVNPMVSLKRTSKLVQGFYKHYDIDLPVVNIVLSRTGFFEGDYVPSNTTLIDKRNYNEWASKMKRLSSPLKFVQLKGAQALLRHSQSTYVRRTEWDSDDSFNLEDSEQ